MMVSAASSSPFYCQFDSLLITSVGLQSDGALLEERIQEWRHKRIPPTLAGTPKKTFVASSESL